MKILLSTPFDFAHPGGVNDHLFHLDRELRRQGHTTRILSPLANNDLIEDDGHHLRIGRSVPVPANGSTARITLSPFVGGKVREFLTREKFDVIHLHEPLTPTLQLSVLAHSNSTNVGTFHASHSSYFGYNLCYFYGKPFLMPFMDKLHARITVSEASQKFVGRYFTGPFETIPNGIDLETYGPDVPAISGLRSEVPTILFVGRFDEPRKGFQYLLEAFGQVQQALPDARLNVVGPGNADPHMRTARRMGIRNLHFIGEVSKSQLPSCYAACDVFCAPSTGQESFGIVLLEAMASGKPIVATEIDGYRSVVRHGREGLLVRPRDSNRLARNLVSLLSNQDLQVQLGNNGRMRARMFSWPEVARRVVECYEAATERCGVRQTPQRAAASLFSGTRRP